MDKIKYLKSIDDLPEGKKYVIWGRGLNSRSFEKQLYKKNIKEYKVVDNLDEYREELIFENEFCLIITPLYWCKKIIEEVRTVDEKRIIYINLMTNMHEEYLKNNIGQEKVKLIGDNLENGKKDWYEIMKLIIECDESRIQDFLLNDNQQYGDQYFDGLNICEGMIIIDGGAKGGNDICKFSEYIGEKGCLFAVDPRLNNERHQNIIYMKKVIGKKKIYKVDINKGDNSKICKNNGGSWIKAIRLDDFMLFGLKHIDIIKLDIEGMELEALKTGKRLILKDKPQLAIAVYHKITHFFEIYEFLRGLNLGYRFSFKGYGPGYSECILYAY